MELIQYIGQRIRELRQNYGGEGGLSQEALAKQLEVTPNTVSRWETATYKPDIQDLEKMGRFFGVSILDFFPKEHAKASEPITALLRAAQDLPEKDLEELRKYAEFRKARGLFKGVKMKPGRKAKQQA
ncbi:MAG: helix-turn-helix transcriptional regulator [Elusimicrobiota bacterium]